MVSAGHGLAQHGRRRPASDHAKQQLHHIHPASEVIPEGRNRQNDQPRFTTSQMALSRGHPGNFDRSTTSRLTTIFTPSTLRASDRSTYAANDMATDSARVVKLMASKVRFLATPAFARIRLIWQDWQQIFQSRISLRTNRPELVTLLSSTCGSRPQPCASTGECRFASSTCSAAQECLTHVGDAAAGEFENQHPERDSLRNHARLFSRPPNDATCY